MGKITIKKKYATLGDYLVAQDNKAKLKARQEIKKDIIWISLACIFIGIVIGYGWRMTHEHKEVERQVRQKLKTSSIQPINLTTIPGKYLGQVSYIAKAKNIINN